MSNIRSGRSVPWTLPLRILFLAFCKTATAVALLIRRGPMGQIISFIRKCFRRRDKHDGEEPDKYGSVGISTPELLDNLSDDTNSSSFNLHQNVASTCIDILEDSASARVLDVNNRVQTPERWIRHYCSSHKILLVGEGDFSFSASLAITFGSATNMIATSLDSRGFLYRNYKNAMSNIHALRGLGCTILHGVDATEMANHCSLVDVTFDRIVYNFPHAGFCTDEPVESGKRRHQLLISLFFENAKKMIGVDGEIHVTHKSNGFFLGWNLQRLGSAVGLKLIQELPFNFTDYPGYRTKYGFGGDKNFNCKPSKTYKFGLILPTPP